MCSCWLTGVQAARPGQRMGTRASPGGASPPPSAAAEHPDQLELVKGPPAAPCQPGSRGQLEAQANSALAWGGRLVGAAGRGRAMPQGKQQLLLPDRLPQPLLPAAQPLASSSHLWGLRLLAKALPVPRVPSTAPCAGRMLTGERRLLAGLSLLTPHKQPAQTLWALLWCSSLASIKGIFGHCPSLRPPKCCVSDLMPILEVKKLKQG